MAGAEDLVERQAAVARVERQPAVDGAGHRHAADVPAQGHHRHRPAARSRAGSEPAPARPTERSASGGEPGGATMARTSPPRPHRCGPTTAITAPVRHGGVGRRAAAGQQANAGRRGQLVGRRHHAAPAARRGPKGARGSVRVRTRPAQSDDDRAQHLAALHAGEGVLDLVDADGLADEAVEVEPSGQVEVDEHGEVPRGEAVAVPARLQRAAAAEELDHGQVDAHVGRGDADLHQGPGQVAGQEGLLHHRRVPDRLDADVGAVATRERADRLDRVGRAGVDGVRRAERRGGLELSRRRGRRR